MAQTPETILKEIRGKKFKPLYFIHGDEPYYIDAIADELEKRVVPEAEKGFNQFIIYGKDTDLTGVLGYARRFPFMAERQIVIVKDANKLGGIEQKEQQARLEDYALNPAASTVLVLCFHANADERKSFIKAIGTHGAVVQSKKMYDNKLPDWVAAFCQQEGVKISPKAIQMLVDNIGNDLKRLSNEVRKIMVNLRVDEGIDAAAVERFVGISKEYNVFEFQKALMQRDVLKANQIASYFSANSKDNPLSPILIILYNFFAKLLLAHASKDKSEKGLAAELGVNPYFVKDYLLAIRNYPLPKVAHVIHYLRECDSRLKGLDGVSIPESELLKELVFKIVH
ncbi:DNA polymerase III subunit delta [Dyadobacter sediminis]|uniref:DNA polymerase III subunit delta n=1 Tax=Dyadobacter sediminis TaxID=1493691 RepID=A0A5R9KJ86_9BACT|nr:DNA polymerase III subunit delta [Dyadobacter sediminis]TLU96244.1 DNA polymerase III subunit delta [Dyadobacter sediminis]GGB80503.1 DNA polymerase III subunit delta [Dyadobacter sediminis]